MILLKEYKRRY